MTIHAHEHTTAKTLAQPNPELRFIVSFIVVPNPSPKHQGADNR
jgi:hypothetical protein